MSGPARSVRLPFDPLERRILARCEERGSAWSRFGVYRPAAAVADFCRVSRAMVSAWRRLGIPEEQADRLALKVGSLAPIVWREEWLADVDVDAA